MSVTPKTFGLTATERSELMNWAVFDALRTFKPLLPGLGDRYLMSPEFEPTDQPQMYARAKKLLESVPPGEPVAIPKDTRASLHQALNSCWFSQRMADNFYVMAGSMGSCFLRARYLFVTHWLAQYSTLPHEYAADWMTRDIEKLSKVGLEKRAALVEVPFQGRNP